MTRGRTNYNTQQRSPCDGVRKPCRKDQKPGKSRHNLSMYDTESSSSNILSGESFIAYVRTQFSNVYPYETHCNLFRRNSAALRFVRGNALSTFTPSLIPNSRLFVISNVVHWYNVGKFPRSDVIALPEKGKKVKGTR